MLAPSPLPSGPDRVEATRPAPRGVLRSLVARLALVVFGLGAGLVAAEAALQAAAVVRHALAAVGEPYATSVHPILAVGDSNTYGLYLREGEEPYPQVFEHLWNARHPGGARVINVGYPGTNSSILLEALPDFLARYHPAVVTIMIGVNDFWTEPVSAAPAGLATRLLRRSRVYPLLFMLVRWVRYSLTPAHSIRPGDDGFVSGDRFVPLGVQARTLPEDWLRELRRNLLLMVGLVRAADATPILLTYPGNVPSPKLSHIEGPYTAANQVIREVARDTNARLIDVAASFGSRCTEAGCDDLLFPDRHPRAAGHRIVAETLLDAWAGAHSLDVAVAH